MTKGVAGQQFGTRATAAGACKAGTREAAEEKVMILQWIL
jgi:hypothetical protein